MEDGDLITINAMAGHKTLDLDVSEEVMAARRAKWVAPPLKYTRGTMHKYIKLVSSAAEGCVTDE